MNFRELGKMLVGLTVTLLQVALSLAQAPETEVYLFDLEIRDNTITISNPRNISQNPGYDNQPNFLHDGSGFLYSSVSNEQSDITHYEIATGKKRTLTQSEGSEYSPTITPDQKYFSTIILEKDGTQLLWKYPLSPGKPQLLVPDLKIGYHCWFDSNTIISFVLGDPVTLQVCDLKTGKNKVVAENIGRSLHKIPQTEIISFVQKESETTWMIKTFDPQTGEIKGLMQTLPGSEDMAWTPNGAILMGQQNRLYKWNPQIDQEWVEITSMPGYGLGDITRLAVSPKADRLAIVVLE